MCVVHLVIALFYVSKETIDVVIAVSGDDTGENESNSSSTSTYQPDPLADEEV